MTQTYTVTIHHNNNTHTIQVAEDQKILAAAQAAKIEDLDLPYSCEAGVCTTCAAQLKSGTVEQGEGMGVSLELQAEGYALLCVAYPRSDIELESTKEEEVYKRQFGKP